MLNTNVNVDGNHFNYNVNAVSGTLRKSHPKSQMVVRELKWDNQEFNVNNPTVWNGERRMIEDIVVLQVMLIGNSQGIIEYVLKKDFEEGWNEINV